MRTYTSTFGSKPTTTIFEVTFNYQNEETKKITKHGVKELKSLIETLKNYNAENVKIYSYNNETKKDVTSKYYK